MSDPTEDPISYGFSVEFPSNDEVHRTQLWKQRALFKMYLVYISHADIRPSWDDFLNFENEMAEAPLETDTNALG